MTVFLLRSAQMTFCMVVCVANYTQSIDILFVQGLLHGFVMRNGTQLTRLYIQ